MTNELCQNYASALYGMLSPSMREEAVVALSSVVKDLKEEPAFEKLLSSYSVSVEEKRRILENRETFAQISDALNFDTPLYFSRVFKKYTGVPPSGYRKSVIRYTNFEPRPGEKKKNAK